MFRVTYAQIIAAVINDFRGKLELHLNRRESGLVVDAVNQGIDSKCEACYCPELGDSYKAVYEPNKILCSSEVSNLHCTISPLSTAVLLRRLLEINETSANGFVVALLNRLGFKDLKPGQFEIISPVDEDQPILDDYQPVDLSCTGMVKLIT